MNDLEENARETAEARSRRLHEEFEAYYAAWERRRLGQEAFARRMVRALAHEHTVASND
jgi:uncharacterized protein (DUF3084 family)